MFSQNKSEYLSFYLFFVNDMLLEHQFLHPGEKSPLFKFAALTWRKLESFFKLVNVKHRLTINEDTKIQFL